MRLPYLAVLGLLHFTACSSNESVFSDKVTVDPISNQDGVPKYSFTEGQEAVSRAGKISWYSCTQDPAGPYMVLVNPGSKAWSPDEACKNPAALSFLDHKLNVIAISRPDKEELGDDKSLDQVKEALTLLQKGNRQFEGLWSMGEGSVLTLRLARLFPWKVLIVGNGIYDMEQTLKESHDQDFIARVKALPGSQDSSFVEKRSAAWDLSGLPKLVYLYHGGRNSQISSNQATQFKNSLAASEHKAELFILDEDAQDLRPEYHRGILSKILETYQKSK